MSGSDVVTSETAYTALKDFYPGLFPEPYVAVSMVLIAAGLLCLFWAAWKTMGDL